MLVAFPVAADGLDAMRHDDEDDVDSEVQFRSLAGTLPCTLTPPLGPRMLPHRRPGAVRDAEPRVAADGRVRGRTGQSSGHRYCPRSLSTLGTVPCVATDITTRSSAGHGARAAKRKALRPNRAAHNGIWADCCRTDLTADAAVPIGRQSAEAAAPCSGMRAMAQAREMARSCR